MANVALGRSDPAEANIRSVTAICFGKRLDFDWITQWGCRTVGFNVADGSGVNACIVERCCDHRCLTIDAWRSEARLLAAVIVGCDAPDDCIDRVAVCFCVHQSLQ